MIEVGRSRDGGDRPNIRWVCQSAEEFAYDSSYSLIEASTGSGTRSSLAWPVPYPDVATAIVGGRGIDTAPWVDGLNTIIPSYSTNKDFAPYNLLDELERRQLFAVVGRKRTRLRSIV